METTSILTDTSKRAGIGAMVSLYGPTGCGKTATIATALGVGPILYLSTPSEGDGPASLRDYGIPMIWIKSYGQLVQVYGALIGKPDYLGDDDELPLHRAIKDTKRSPGLWETEQVAELAQTLAELKPAVIAFDSIAGCQQLDSAHSIWYWGKDMGKGRYGDIANLTRARMFKYMSLPSIRMLVLIALDRQVEDEGRGTVYREMAFEGQKSREIIPPACNFVLPVFTGEELGLAEDKREWTWKYRNPAGKVIEETRNRFFALQPRRGYWAKARGPMSIKVGNLMKANLTALYRKFYVTPKPKPEDKTDE